MPEQVLSYWKDREASRYDDMYANILLGETQNDVVCENLKDEPVSLDAHAQVTQTRWSPCMTSGQHAVVM